MPVTKSVMLKTSRIRIDPLIRKVMEGGIRPFSPQKSYHTTNYSLLLLPKKSLLSLLAIFQSTALIKVMMLDPTSEVVSYFCRYFQQFFFGAIPAPTFKTNSFSFTGFSSCLPGVLARQLRSRRSRGGQNWSYLKAVWYLNLMRPKMMSDENKMILKQINDEKN